MRITNDHDLLEFVESVCLRPGMWVAGYDGFHPVVALIQGTVSDVLPSDAFTVWLSVRSEDSSCYRDDAWPLHVRSIAQTEGELDREVFGSTPILLTLLRLIREFVAIGDIDVRRQVARAVVDLGGKPESGFETVGGLSFHSPEHISWHHAADHVEVEAPDGSYGRLLVRQTIGCAAPTWTSIAAADDHHWGTWIGFHTESRVALYREMSDALLAAWCRWSTLGTPGRPSSAT